MLTRRQKADYKTYLENNKTVLKTLQRFRSEEHNVFTEKINKIALSVNDNNTFTNNTSGWLLLSSHIHIAQDQESVQRRIDRTHKILIKFFSMLRIHMDQIIIC